MATLDLCLLPSGSIGDIRTPGGPEARLGGIVAVERDRAGGLSWPGHGHWPGDREAEGMRLAVQSAGIRSSRNLPGQTYALRTKGISGTIF